MRVVSLCRLYLSYGLSGKMIGLMKVVEEFKVRIVNDRDGYGMKPS